MDPIYVDFEASGLAPLEIDVLLTHYRRTHDSIFRKLQNLEDGTHTIMSERGMVLLREMKDTLQQRIEALISRRLELKKKR